MAAAKGVRPTAAATRKLEAPDPDLDRRLALLTQHVEKEVEGAKIQRFSDKPEAWPAMPSGSLALDVALGIGGYAHGRIIEIFGPESSGKTTLVLHAIANAQRAGGIAAFIDAEHALDPTYAKQIGVDTKRLILSQPDNGEQALGIADSLLDVGMLGAGDVIVIDSVAALVPKAEIEGDMGDSHMGLQARLMSQALRKMTAKAARAGVIIFFINQIRMKIGVMFGCFSYGSRVELADGSSEKIGKIVNQRLPVEVLAFDPETGQISPRKVVDWHDNGNADYFLQIVAEGVGGSGRSTFGVTPNHNIFVFNGGKWVERAAGDLVPGDLVAGRALSQFNHVQRQVAIGSVLGDGSLRQKSRHLTSLRIGHGKDQIDYARWKQEIFEGCVSWSGTNTVDGWNFDCRPSADMNEIFKEAYDPTALHGRRLSSTVLQELNLLGVAIWYMDDGCFSGSYEKWGKGKVEISVKSYSVEECNLLAQRLETLGVGRPTVTADRRLCWSGARTAQLHEAIAKYVPPCMQWKLHPEAQGNYQHLDLPEQVDSWVAVPVPIVEIYQKPPTRSMRRFDLTVEGLHTYFVDGVAVHNSPETTTGGNALKFYASVRIDIRRTGSVDEGGKSGAAAGEDGKGASPKIANLVRIKVVKNKMAPPFQEAETQIRFGEGLDNLGELVSLGVKAGVVEQSGAWYAFGGERIGQGRENVRHLLKTRPDLAWRIEQQIRAAMSLPALGGAIPALGEPVPAESEGSLDGDSGERGGLTI